MNNLNMDPSLNLIFKYHGLVLFWFHLYSVHRHLWNGARFNCVILVCACSVFFTFSFVFGIFWSIGYHVWGWPSWLGVFPREHHESHFSYYWKFSRCLRAIWATLKCLKKDVEMVWGHDFLSYKLKVEALQRHREWECTGDSLQCTSLLLVLAAFSSLEGFGNGEWWYLHGCAFSIAYQDFAWIEVCL